MVAVLQALDVVGRCQHLADIVAKVTQSKNVSAQMLCGCAEDITVDLNACTPERALVVLMAWISQLASLVRAGRPGAIHDCEHQSEGAVAMPNAYISAGAGGVHVGPLRSVHGRFCETVPHNHTSEHVYIAFAQQMAFVSHRENCLTIKTAEAYAGRLCSATLHKPDSCPACSVGTRRPGEGSDPCAVLGGAVVARQATFPRGLRAFRTPGLDY